MGKTVLGIFIDREDAEDALYELEFEGYNPKDISIVMKNTAQGKQLAEDTKATVTGNAAAGATTGGIIGALAGLLVATGIVPGLGALLIGGPLAAALGLTGAAATTISGAATGALAGGLLGILTGLGISKEEAEVYEERIKEGGILIAVPAASDRVDEVMDILEDNGADQIRAIEQVRDRLETRKTARADADAPYTRSGYYNDPTYNPVGAKGGQVSEGARSKRKSRRLSSRRRE